MTCSKRQAGYYIPVQLEKTTKAARWNYLQCFKQYYANVKFGEPTRK